MQRVARMFLVGAALVAACDRPHFLPETPRIEVSAPSLSFTAPGGGLDPPSEQVWVIIVGGPLNLTGVSVAYAQGSGWLSISTFDPTHMPGEPGQWVTVRAHAAGLASGTYQATLFIEASGVVNSPFPVQVSLVVPPPRIAVSADDVQFDVTGAELPPAQEIIVTNAGGGLLDQPTASIEYAEGSGWLSVTESGSTDHYSVTVRPDLAKITMSGKLFAAVTLSVPNAESRTIGVTMWVRPLLHPSTGFVVFEIVPGGPAPAPRAVSLDPVTAPGVTVPPPTVNVGQTWIAGQPDGVDPVGCDGWLKAATPGSGPPYSVTLTPVAAVVNALPAGWPNAACAAIVNVQSVNAWEQLLVIVIAWSSLEVPLIQPSIKSFSFLALSGGEDPVAQTFTVMDAYGSAIPTPTLSVSSNVSGWLTVDTSGPAAPYSVSVQPHIAGLTAGQYDAGVQAGDRYGVVVDLFVKDWGYHGSFAEPLRRVTANVLPDGKLLFIGTKDYQSDGGPPPTGFEVYDPTGPLLRTRSTRAQGSLRSPRAGHTATSLPDGRVIAAGGFFPSWSDQHAIDSWEIFEPATGTWRVMRPLLTARFEHTATLLADGSVLVAGGATGSEAAPVVLADAEILDANDATSFPTAAMESARRSASAVRLADGRVLVAGGRAANGDVLATAELFDPALQTWYTTGPMSAPRMEAALILLDDGRVLVAGGSDGANALASAELYDPSTGIWTPTQPMATARVAPGVRLPSGKVLLVAGATGDLTQTTGSLERYDPSTGTWSEVAPAPWGVIDPRIGPSVALLPSGRVVIAGGADAPGWSDGNIRSDVILGPLDIP